MQEMTDIERVCCMCGDVGFPDKIYRCIKCHHRFQHSYCSNYYSEASKELCEWCQTDEMKSSKHSAGSSKKPKLEAGIISNRSQYSGDKIKQQAGREEAVGNSEKMKSPTAGSPSPRTKRYKLLKDVMC
uniref:uncharacterized protein LOC122600422 n=1 Tax=Erigeron canadensis TaxID=72917 RepID=UPI001CB9A3F3|nr:uncharacterized protein LOC122600422 [Erigeron canadensis]